MDEKRYLERTVDDEIIGDECWKLVTRVPARLHLTLTNLISCFQFSKVECFKIVCVCWLRMVIRKLRKRKLGSD